MTSNAEIIVFHMQNTIYNQYGKYYFSNEFVNLSTRYSINHLYSNAYIFDICDFKKEDGTYYKVYGKAEMGNPHVDVGTYFVVG